MHMLLKLHLLADLERRQFNVPSDSDVVDDVHANTIRKLDFMSIGKFHLKHISSKLQYNLK